MVSYVTFITWLCWVQWNLPHTCTRHCTGGANALTHPTYLMPGGVGPCDYSGSVPWSPACLNGWDALLASEGSKWSKGLAVNWYTAEICVMDSFATLGSSCSHPARRQTSATPQGFSSNSQVYICITFSLVTDSLPVARLCVDTTLLFRLIVHGTCLTGVLWWCAGVHFCGLPPLRKHCGWFQRYTGMLSLD